MAPESGSASAKPSKVSDKRREQLRKAQRSHRERSRAYQESLEQEIISLRAQDSHELQACKTENAFLRQLLELNNIPIPDLTQSRNDSVSTHVCIDKQNRVHLQIQQQTSPSHTVAAFSSPGTYPSSESHLSPHDTSSSIAYSGGVSPAPSPDPGLVQIGVNFILYLEHPCMDHAHLLSGNHRSNNHAFTSSTALFSFVSKPPEQLVDSARHGNDTTWQSPTTQLEGLMHLCDQFVPEGEIAPVQMWQQVTAAIQSQRLQLTNVPALQQSLAELVECRGFGSAMEQLDFERLLNSFCGAA